MKFNVDKLSKKAPESLQELKEHDKFLYSENIMMKTDKKTGLWQEVNIEKFVMSQMTTPKKKTRMDLNEV